jgi:integrase
MAGKQRSNSGLKRGEGWIVIRTTSAGIERYQANWHERDSSGRMRPRAATFGTIEEAEDHLRTIARAQRSGTYAPESQLTLSELLDEYLARGKSRWSSNTYASYASICKDRIPKGLGKSRVVEITPRQLQRWLDTLGDSLGASSVSNAKIVVSGAMREAVVLGIRATNPTVGLKLPKRPRPDYETWSTDHVRAILDATRKNLKLHTMYLVALTTGMRPGEWRAIKWHDIDFDAGTITCRRSMTRDDQFRAMVGDTTKTRKTRIIAIPVETKNALRRLRTEQLTRQVAHTAWHETDLIFDRGDGRFIPLNSLQRWHSQAVASAKAAKVPTIRLHDLRHTAATLMLHQNIHPKIVSDILGHSSVTMTLDRYSHVSVDLQRTAIDLLAADLIPESVHESVHDLSTTKSD